MARVLSQTLIRGSQSLIGDTFACASAASGHHHLAPLSARLVSLRGRSDRPEKAQVVEVVLSAEVAAEGAEIEVISFRRLEDAIHGAVAKELAPAWLPFVPGASYWVPPPRRRGAGIVEVIWRPPIAMADDEAMSIAATRGWPSSKYFMEGISPHAVKRIHRKATVQSDDEE